MDTFVHRQSPDIAGAVETSKERREGVFDNQMGWLQGAGDGHPPDVGDKCTRYPYPADRLPVSAGRTSYAPDSAVKTNTFVKSISAELELLIEKAIQYTGKMYGDTVSIFVDEKNTKRPLQYNTVRNKVMDLLQKKDLRDDKGELFGFGTHMFCYVYGIRLTELHLDDWTIAKLLGYTLVKNVKFYRKMNFQIITDETREIRAEMSRMIWAKLAGWGKEYEQI